MKCTLRQHLQCLDCLEPAVSGIMRNILGELQLSQGSRNPRANQDVFRFPCCLTKSWCEHSNNPIEAIKLALPASHVSPFLSPAPLIPSPAAWTLIRSSSSCNYRSSSTSCGSKATTQTALASLFLLHSHTLSPNSNSNSSSRSSRSNNGSKASSSNHRNGTRISCPGCLRRQHPFRATQRRGMLAA